MNDEIEYSLRNTRKLRETSIKTYKSTFNKIGKHFDIKVLSQEWLKGNVDVVMDWVATQSHGSKVAIYSSLLVLLSPARKKQPAEKYGDVYNRINELLKKENNSYQDMKANQEKSEKEKDNWINWPSIQKFYNKYEKIMLAQVKMQGGADHNFQKLVILACYVLLPPRRLDYSGVQLIAEVNYLKLPLKEKRINNYLVLRSKRKKYFSWGSDANKSKTKENFLIVNLPAKLNKVISIWLDYNTSNFLLISPKGFELSKNQLSKQITDIFVTQFGKRVGSSMLRKSFLSYLYKDDVKWKMKLKIASLLNHSIDTGQINYVKH